MPSLRWCTIYLKIARARACYGETSQWFPLNPYDAHQMQLHQGASSQSLRRTSSRGQKITHKQHKWRNPNKDPKAQKRQRDFKRKLISPIKRVQR